LKVRVLWTKFATYLDRLKVNKKPTYQIETYQDFTFTQGSADNLHKYDYEYFDQSNFRFSTVFGIKVYENNFLLKSAVIGSKGGGTTIHKNAKIYEEEKILICCSDSIFCLSIPALTLLWRTNPDDFTCFEIFKYQDDYIVHGETQISRISKNGEILWQQSGADIFVALSGTDDFTLTEEFIIVKDFENRIYKFGYDGKDFTDMKQFSN
jgi:hypothetical protein